MKKRKAEESWANTVTVTVVMTCTAVVTEVATVPVVAAVALRWMKTVISAISISLFVRSVAVRIASGIRSLALHLEGLCHG